MPGACHLAPCSTHAGGQKLPRPLHLLSLGMESFHVVKEAISADSVTTGLAQVERAPLSMLMVNVGADL